MVPAVLILGVGNNFGGCLDAQGLKARTAAGLVAAIFPIALSPVRSAQTVSSAQSSRSSRSGPAGPVHPVQPSRSSWSVRDSLFQSVPGHQARPGSTNCPPHAPSDGGCKGSLGMTMGRSIALQKSPVGGSRARQLPWLDSENSSTNTHRELSHLLATDVEYDIRCSAVSPPPTPPHPSHRELASLHSPIWKV